MATARALTAIACVRVTLQECSASSPFAGSQFPYLGHPLSIIPAMHQLPAVQPNGKQLHGFHLGGRGPAVRFALHQDRVDGSNRHDVPLPQQTGGAGTAIRYGCRRLHALLSGRGHEVNVKRVYRLYVEERLMVRRKKRKRLLREQTLEPQLTGVNQE